MYSPGGVAVDTAGAVYVTDYGDNRVLKMPAGSTTQVRMPISGLRDPEGVAVDSAGNIYVASAWQQPGGQTAGGFDRPS